MQDDRIRRKTDPDVLLIETALTCRTMIVPFRRIPKVNQELILVLAQLLHEAQIGTLKGIAYVAKSSNDDCSSDAIGESVECCVALTKSLLERLT